MRRRARAALFVGSVVMLISCGGSESPTTTDAKLNGSYTGVVEDSAGGVGAVRAEFVYSFGALTGTWRVNGGGFLSDTYNIMGSTIDDGEVRFNVTRNQWWPGGAYIIEDGNCSYRMAGIVQGTALTGSYDTFACPVQRTGTFRLTR